MDLVPRIRQPTPPKRNAREELEEMHKHCGDNCKSCLDIKDKYTEMLQENIDIKNQLEKLRSQMDRMRTLSKTQSVN